MANNLGFINPYIGGRIIQVTLMIRVLYVRMCVCRCMCEGVCVCARACTCSAAGYLIYWRPWWRRMPKKVNTLPTGNKGVFGTEHWGFLTYPTRVEVILWSVNREELQRLSVLRVPKWPVVEHQLPPSHINPRFINYYMVFHALHNS